MIDVKNQLKSFFYAHEVFMRSPRDFIFGVFFVGIVLKLAYVFMVLSLPHTNNKLIMIAESVLYLSLLGVFFAYPFMRMIVENVIKNGKVNWKNEIIKFKKSPKSIISKSISGGFIFAIFSIMSILLLCLLSYLLSFFIGFNSDLIMNIFSMIPKYESSNGVFDFALLSVSIVPLNWMISAIFFRTIFPSEYSQSIHLRTTSSLILIIICTYTLLSSILSYMPKDFSILSHFLSAVFLIYFISLMSINDHRARKLESDNALMHMR